MSNSSLDLVGYVTQISNDKTKLGTYQLTPVGLSLEIVLITLLHLFIKK